MTGRCLTVGLLLTLLGGTALAEPARELLQQGMRHYTYGDYDAAIQVLTRATTIDENHELLAKAYLYIGLSQAVKGDDDAAEQAFVTALAHDPHVQPDPYRIKPELIALFERTRARWRARQPESRPASRRVDPAPPRPVQPLPAQAPPSRRKRLWTWLALGGGVACAITAGALWASVRSDLGPYNDRATPDPVARQLEDTIRRKVVATNVMIGLGSALGAAAVVLFFVEGRREAAPRVQPGVGADSRGVWVTAGGRF